MIVVSEIKSGKAAYTGYSGAYTPLLDFYDPQIQGTTFRKAEVIPTITQCRIQLLGDGLRKTGYRLWKNPVPLQAHWHE